MANSKKAARAVDAQGLLKHLHYFLENHLPPKADVTLGLSGGLDSCVLLHFLAQLRQPLDFQLSAIHVNHQISPNAGEWSRFCEKLCTDMGVPLKVVEVDVPRNSGLGLEAAAREARYGALLEHGSGMLVLAHHQDDQAETMLLQLLRGAGVDGLSAMPAAGQMGDAKVLRPLLDIPRAVIQICADEVGLHWIEDESNQDSCFDRNFLRNEVMPLLKSRFPACTTTLARSSENFADCSVLLAQVAEEDAKSICSASKLNIHELQKLPQVRAMNLLRWWVCQETGLRLSRSRLSEILSQLFFARPEAQVECNLDGLLLRRYRQWAYVDQEKEVAPYQMKWDGMSELNLPDGSRLTMQRGDSCGMRPEVITHGIVVSNRVGKPENGKLEIRLESNRPTRALKNLWQEAGTPPWERERTPLLWSGDVLVGVPTFGVEFDCKVMMGETGLVVKWLK